ncbi:MAG: hypothetical protein KGH61_02535 [Candidatus Micrarchaeota archaeon]|nr:hypothetical protein [Candidatus Micrarchaeota archaeon]MDE1847803.1 hypothetical protein [Candidatus Micrarchaeota archaeon]MDE1864241.1 hypothetical protein [Candidatus Micrarchaeota archaeon]
MLIRIQTRQLVQILALFLIVQFGGILLASTVFSSITPSLTTTAPISTAPEALYLFGFLIFFAIVLLVVIRFYKGELLFTLIEAYTVIVTSFFFFSILLQVFFPDQSGYTITAAALALGVLLLVAKWKRPRIRNAVVVISSIGFGIVLGLYFRFNVAFAFSLMVAAYDYISVFITKHMITFAKVLSSRNLAFLISASDIEVASPDQVDKSERKVYQKHLQEVKKIDNPVIQQIIRRGDIPLIAQIQLGAGDLGLPLMLSISAYSISFSYFLSIAITTGAAIGLLATMFFLMRYKTPLPAIPPIFAFICIALGIALALTKTVSLYTSLLLVSLGVFLIFVAMYLTLRFMEKKGKETKR